MVPVGLPGPRGVHLPHAAEQDVLAHHGRDRDELIRPVTILQEARAVVLVHGAREVVAKQRADDAGERRGRCRPEAKVGALDTPAIVKGNGIGVLAGASEWLQGYTVWAQAAHALLLPAQRAALRKREAPRAVGIRLYRLPGRLV
eukprot:scaffold22132_cov69-Phaeocystis_antarctica.AAC.4